MSKAVAVCMGALAAGACVAQDTGRGQSDEDTFRMVGRLTDEGVECQALRAADGTLYTLLGDLEGFEVGDEVEVEATRVEFSFCMQGQTVQVRAISSADE